MVKRMTVRLEDALYERLRAAADHDHRSIHSQLLWIIEGAVPRSPHTCPYCDWIGPVDRRAAQIAYTHHWSTEHSFGRITSNDTTKKEQTS